MSLIAVEPSNLDRRHSQGRPSRPPEPRELVTARLVNVHQMVRAEGRLVVEVEVAQIRVPFQRNTARCFLRPPHRREGPADTVGGHKNLELVPEENDHLVLIHVRSFGKAATQHCEHGRGYASGATDAVGRCCRGSEASQVRSNRSDRARAAACNRGPFSIVERLTLDHVSNLIMLGEGKIRRHGMDCVSTDRRCQARRGIRCWRRRKTLAV